VITNDVSDYINLLVRIAHIICNHSLYITSTHSLNNIHVDFFTINLNMLAILMVERILICSGKLRKMTEMLCFT